MKFDMNRLARIIKFFQQAATDNFNRDGYLVPCVFGEPEAGTLVIAPIVGAGEFTSATAQAFMRTLILKGSPHAAVAVECWMVQRKVNETREWSGRLGQHPDRIEVVTISVNIRQGTVLSMAKIIREEGQPPRLGEWENSPLTKECEGRLAAVFEQVARQMAPMN
jgi:hypothetical protein